jgi:hypothetical protein
MYYEELYLNDVDEGEILDVMEEFERKNVVWNRASKDKNILVVSKDTLDTALDILCSYGISCSYE